MDSDAATALMTNVKQLRVARGFSQKQCADLAGIPRPTWAHLESGDANPTLGVLLRAAAALQVSIEELIRPPRGAGDVYRAGTLPRRQKGGCEVRALLPDTIVGTQFERLELTPGAHMRGVPHTPGTREYLVCETGRIELNVAGDAWQLEPGDVVLFRGDQKHSYRNPTLKRAVAYSVVALAAGSALPVAF